MSRLTEKKALELSMDVWRHVAEVLKTETDPDELGIDGDGLTLIKSAYINLHQYSDKAKYCNGALPYLSCWLCEFYMVSWSSDSCSDCALSVKNAETEVVHGCESPASLYNQCEASLARDDLHNAARFAEMIVETLEKALEEVNKAHELHEHMINMAQAEVGGHREKMVVWTLKEAER